MDILMDVSVVWWCLGGCVGRWVVDGCVNGCVGR